MKNVILFFSMLCSMTSHAQSKRKQIENLNVSIDSLKNVLTTERTFSNQNNLNLNSKISSLENQIKILNTSIYEKEIEEKLLKENNLAKDREIQIKIDENNVMRQKIRELRDSLKNISEKIDTLVWDIPDSLTWDNLEFRLKLLIPISKFNSPKDNLLISRDNKILISYGYNNTHAFANNEGSPLFYKENDAINYYSKDLEDIEITENEGFIIKGKNASKQLIIIKGLYRDFVSMQGRDKGKPTWLWSNTLIVKITANQVDKDEFNSIYSPLINNFTTKSIVSKY